MEAQVDFEKLEKIKEMKAMLKILPVGFPVVEKDLYEIYSQEDKN